MKKAEEALRLPPVSFSAKNAAGAAAFADRLLSGILLKTDLSNFKDRAFVLPNYSWRLSGHMSRPSV